MEDLKVQRRRRGHCWRLTETQLRKVDNLERSELLKNRDRKDNAKSVHGGNIFESLAGCPWDHQETLGRFPSLHQDETRNQGTSDGGSPDRKEPL